jgi:hypothetical protein
MALASSTPCSGPRHRRQRQAQAPLPGGDSNACTGSRWVFEVLTTACPWSLACGHCRSIAHRRRQNDGSDLFNELQARRDSVKGRHQLQAIRREELSRGVVGVPDIKEHGTAIWRVDHQRLGTEAWRTVGFALRGLRDLANPHLIELGTEAESQENFDHGDLLVESESGSLNDVWSIRVRYWWRRMPADARRTRTTSRWTGVRMPASSESWRPVPAPP